MSEPKPKKPRERAVVKIKEPDGSWHELKTDPPPSDDPDVVSLWDMPIGDLRTIVEDEQHALHDKALFVTERAFSPLTGALQEWAATQDALVKPIQELVKPIEALDPKIDSLLPAVDTSWISKLVPEYPKWQNRRRWTSEPEAKAAFVVDSIDFDAVTPPDISIGAAASAAGDAAIVVLQEILAVHREQLAQAKVDSSANGDGLEIARQSLKAAKGSRTAGWWAAGAAIAAAVIAAVGIAVTIALSGGN